MAKLYLIRRNLETFAGPMTLSEMKEAYKRMQFGLQDEVAGHCGPWVVFENLTAVKKHYPEIARIVNEDMLAGWGISDHNARLINEDTRRIEVRRVRGAGLAVTFLVIAVVAFAAAIYMANGSHLSGKAKGQQGFISPEEPQALLDRGDHAGFEAYMDEHAGEMVGRIVRARKPELQWLPYLRYYAFQHDGVVNGLPPKYLRGGVATAAPIDCSLKMWHRRWRASIKSWNDLIVQRKLPLAHWARILAWDPYWIRRRDNRGWIGTQNFYVGCLTMANHAMADLLADPSLVSTAADWDRMGATKIKQRLQWLLEMARDGRSSVPTAVTAGNNLSIWTCFEAAHDVKGLAKCRDGTAGSTALDPWQAYNDERYAFNLLRLAVTETAPLPSDLAAALAQQTQRIGKSDHFTRFDYRSELKLLHNLTQTGGGATEKAAAKATSEGGTGRTTH